MIFFFFAALLPYVEVGALTPAAEAAYGALLAGPCLIHTITMTRLHSAVLNPFTTNKIAHVFLSVKAQFESEKRVSCVNNKTPPGSWPSIWTIRPTCSSSRLTFATGQDTIVHSNFFLTNCTWEAFSTSPPATFKADRPAFGSKTKHLLTPFTRLSCFSVLSTISRPSVLFASA